jgi:hypothetical protein
MNNILHRISKISDLENITISKIEQKIGASKGVLYKAIQKNTDIQSKWLVLIVENFPQYNSEWLLTGKGSILKNDTSNRLSQNITGDSNIQSGNDTNGGDNTIQVKKLEQELKECKNELKEKDKTISQLVNLMSSK